MRKTTVFILLLAATAVLASEPEPIAVTMWGRQAELFVEFPPLVVGQPSRFAVHLTDTRDSERFLAVTSGPVAVELQVSGAPAQAESTGSPRIPGIYGVTVVPKAAGAAKVTISLDGAGARDRFTFDAEVFSGPDAVKEPAPEPEPAGEEVPFLKEQQWQIPFATVPVTKRRVARIVRAVGDVASRAGGEVRMHVPKSGRLQAAPSSSWPIIGQKVRAGELLAIILPGSPPELDRAQLDLENRQASVEHEAAQRLVARAERLAAQGAIARREIDEARKQLALVRERLAAARKRLEYLRSRQAGTASTVSAGAEEYHVRSPIDGTIVSLHASDGHLIEAGEELFTVLDSSRLWIVGRVYEPDIPDVRATRSASFRFLGVQEAMTLEGLSGRLLNIGDLVDPKTRTVSVVFEVANHDGALKVGQFAEIELETGEPREVVAVPEAALLDDGGRDIVFVQAGGESFRKRRVRLGARSRGYAEVLGGVSDGERVATTGSYEIYLQSVSRTIPEHGHAH